MIEAGRADVNTDNARVRPADCVFGGLPRPASGNKDVQVGAVWPVRPQQMIFRSVSILVPPLIASSIQILDRRWIGMMRVEVANGVSTHLEYTSVPEALDAVKHLATGGGRRSSRV